MSTESRQQFVVVLDIAVSAARVWEVIGEPRYMMQWIPMCVGAHWTHPPGASGTSTGSVRHIQLRAGMGVDERMAAYDEEGRSLRYAFDRTSIPFDRITSGYYGVQAVEPLGPDRSRLSWAVHFESPGALALIALPVRLGLRAFIGVMASNVKKVAESVG